MIETVFVCHPDKARKYLNPGRSSGTIKKISSMPVGVLGHKRYRIKSESKPCFVSEIEATPFNFGFSVESDLNRQQRSKLNNTIYRLAEVLKLIMYQRLHVRFDNYDIIKFSEPTSIHIYPQYDGEYIYVTKAEQKLLRSNVFEILDLTPISSNPIVWKSLLNGIKSGPNLSNPLIDQIVIGTLIIDQNNYDQDGEPMEARLSEVYDFRDKILKGGGYPKQFHPELLINYDGIAFYNNKILESISKDKLDEYLNAVKIASCNDILSGLLTYESCYKNETILKSLDRISELKGYELKSETDGLVLTRVYKCPDGSDIKDDLRSELLKEKFIEILTGSWVDLSLEEIDSRLNSEPRLKDVRVMPDGNLLIRYSDLEDLYNQVELVESVVGSL